MSQCRPACHRFFSACEFFISASHQHFENVSLIFWLLWFLMIVACFGFDVSIFSSYCHHQHFLLLMIISHILNLKYHDIISLLLFFPSNSSCVPLCCLSNSWLFFFNFCTYTCISKYINTICTVCILSVYVCVYI